MSDKTTKPRKRAQKRQPARKKAAGKTLMKTTSDRTTAKPATAKVTSSNRTQKRPHQSELVPVLKARVTKLRAQLDQAADELTHRRGKEVKQLLLELRPELRQRSHNVYVVELDEAVRKDKSFREKNEEQLDTGNPCFYVGMTGLDPELRYANHKAGTKHSRLVKKYGSRLRPEFYLAVNPMTHNDAAAMEKELAVRLRLAGYPTWQN